MRRLGSLLAVLAVVAAACASDDPVFEAEVEAAVEVAGCDWPMFGRDPGRSFATSCPSGITSESVDDLRRVWFFPTDDVVSAAPVVVGDGLYVGDWTGVFYALDAASGAERWRVQLATNPLQYGGQISASAAWAEVAGRSALVVASGRTVHAVAADDGTVLWDRPLGREGSTTEILGSPVVVGNLVVVGFDAHGAPEPTGVLALDLTTGEEVWYFDPELGTPRGCGGVWGSPTVDRARGLVVVGTANCPSGREGWNRYTEALVALDVATGEPRWSFQPRPEPDDRDADFAGAPNLFTGADGRDLVGLGNKDASYYAVDRDTGELVWSTAATDDGYISPNFSSGGFIGPSAIAGGLVIGATAVGDCPCFHALDTTTGEIVWQQLAVGPSYAPTTVVGDLAFIASIDTVLRAVDVATGEVVWSDSLGVLASGGVAARGDDLWAVAGFREPGSPGPSERSGVMRYTVDVDVVSSTTTTTTTTVPTDGAVPVRLVDAAGRCIDTACALGFQLKDPPAGLTPSLELTIRADPFAVEVVASGLGDPAAWLREGSEAEAVGAEAFGVMISERDDDPNGGFLCVLDDDLTCTGTSVPNPGASYNRISVLALADTDEVPDAADGFARLVDSIAFDPPLQTEQLAGDGDGDSDAEDRDEDEQALSPGTVVFSGQGNDLVGYGLDGTRQVVIPNAGDDPVDGRDINAQICFLDDRTFLAGEDTGQPEVAPGWGVFRLEGDTIGELTATQVGKLVPTYQPADSQPEMFGCGVLADGRVVLTDVGNQALGPGTGQLLLFFPPDADDPAASYRGEITDHCKLDIELATAQQIAVDGDDVLVAAARPPTVGVWRYTDLPRSPDECDGPLSRTLFIDPADGGLGIANGVARSPAGGWFVSSVFTGVINEYGPDGGFVREILRPPAGETLGPEPFSTGTPNGLAVDAEGSLWYADLGIVVNDAGGIGPGRGTGTVRVIRFVDGVPQPPEVIDDGLAFPDALGVLP